MIENDRPSIIYLPIVGDPDCFRFAAGTLQAALKPYDCKAKKRGDSWEPSGDYLSLCGVVVHACHIKSILAECDKTQIVSGNVIPGQSLTLSWDNTRFELLHQKVDPERVFVASLVNGDVVEPTPPVNPWLQRACSKDKARESLMTVWSNRSTDGFRLHLDNSLPDPSPLPPWDIDPIIAPCRDNPNVAILQVKPLTAAIKQAMAINKDILRMSFNGRLELIARDEDNGDTHITMESGYQYSGPDALVAINPKFLLDAISGMEPEFIFALAEDSAKRPVYITSGTREVVIMPLHLD
jgi:hypothetical protein